MLALFLEARIVARRQAHGETPAQARRAVERVVCRDGGVSRGVYRAARAGRLRNGAHRARLWAALGVFPADRGISLTDDGGQHRCTPNG